MVQFSFNADLGSVLRELRICAQHASFSDQWVDGGRFISIQSDGILYALYNHPTKPHGVLARVERQTCTLPKVVREAESSAPPGIWALAYIKSSLFGEDQTFYFIL